MRQGSESITLLPLEDTIIINDTAIISIQGRLTISDYESFYEIGQEALAITSDLVVNLAGADFLDSSAIGLLIDLAKQAREKGGEMWLASVPEAIKRTLTILRLENFFVFSPSVDQVLKQKGILLGSRTETEIVQPPAGDLDASGARWAVVKTPRRFDATTSNRVLEDSRATLDKNPFLILDLSDTVFLASAGLAVLAKIDRLAKERNGELRVANCTRDVLKVIEIVRFDKVLAIYNDIPSASR